MKRKVLVIALAVAMLALPLSAVSATKPEKIPLYLVAGPFPDGFSSPEPWASGNIQHGRGATGFMPMCYIVRLDPMGVLMIGSGTQIWDYNVNTETGKGVAHVKWVIVLGEGTEDTSDDGTFEGNENIVGEFTFFGDDLEYANPYTVHSYCVLRGTGAYQGWKIVLEVTLVEGDYSNAETNNYLIKPID